MANSPRIVYLTAGAAGMYCGSCMHDNTLARALGQAGVDVELLPLYTPIRTDEVDVSHPPVFFGGISVYLRQKLPILRRLPAWATRIFDRPWLLRRASELGVKTDASELGELTLSMLRGAAGEQRAEVERMCRWLERHPPDLVVLSNMLIGGSVPEIKRRLKVPVLVTLQGDDVFLDGLPEDYRRQAVAEMNKLAAHVDGFLVHSHYYAQHMSRYLGIGSQSMHRVPLGIDPRGLELPASEPSVSAATRPPTIGYLARLDPVKGLDQLLEAFVLVRQRPGLERARLRIGGWLGHDQRSWFEEHLKQARQALPADEADAIEYVGVVDRHGKAELLASIDVLSVPTRHPDPKGLFVLEALAAGVPVVEPDHGAFPELLAATGGGRLFRAGDTAHLAELLAELLLDETARRELGAAGRQRVRQDFHASAMAAGTLEVLRRFLPHAQPAG